MTAGDPADAAHVAAAVRSLASRRFGVRVDLDGPPRSVGAGFDSYIHLVGLRGDGLPAEWAEPLVVRILPRADRIAQAHTEAAIQGWCADRAYPAPRVLAVLEPGELLDLPVQIMERMPGGTMLDAVKARPWRTRRLVDQLVALHLRLHALPTDAWPGSGDAGGLVDARLRLPRLLAPELGDGLLVAALARAEEAAGALRQVERPVVCHGDFHPLNVMVDGDRAGVIDWTDAALGPREGDVSRTLLLFQVASIAADSALERRILRRIGPRLARRYRSTYEGDVELDATLLRRWEALHALHGWTQIVALRAGAFDGGSSSAGREDRVPVELVGWLRERFDQALT